MLVIFPVAGRRGEEGFTLAHSSRAHSLLLKEGVAVKREAENEGGENAGAQARFLIFIQFRISGLRDHDHIQGESSLSS